MPCDDRVLYPAAAGYGGREPLEVALPPVFGHLPDQPIGTIYASRTIAGAAGMHTPGMQGISGNGEIGAHSIVASGSYVDDEDHGDYLIYTGMGGRDPATGRQIADQNLAQYANAALVTSELSGQPVRVLRGSGGDPKYAPATGFRYDGLFQVTRHWTGIGQDGYRIVQFRLERLPNQPEPAGMAAPEEDPAYKSSTVVRRIRNSQIAQQVKDLYESTCQVCETQLQVAGRHYAEGAHIRPLGRPHVGPDTADNLLCLCPNHHVQLDMGGIIITDDFRVIDRTTGHPIGPLYRKGKHAINVAHLAYQRSMWPPAGS